MNAANGRRREQRFARVMRAQGINVIRNHRRFKFGLTAYTPDFYDPATETYYEVIGSRQRFSRLTPTFDLMRHCCPESVLRVVTPEGQPYRRRRATRRRGLLRLDVEDALFRRGMTIKALAEQANILPQTLSVFLCGKSESATLGQRLAAWVETGTMPPTPQQTWQDHRTATGRATRAAATALRARIARDGLVAAAIARGIGVMPQYFNTALNGYSPNVLARAAAWLDGPGANDAAREDRRRTATRGRSGETLASHPEASKVTR